MSKQMLELLGTCLKENSIEWVIWNQEPSMSIPVDIDENAVDYLYVVWESEFDDHGVATGEFTYKVSHDEYGTIYKSTSTVDVCEFIKNEIENILDDVCF